MKRERPTQCSFCTANASVIDYKEAEFLRKFVNPQGKIAKRTRTGVCATHQRLLSQAIKRARFLGLLAYTIR
ncbi:MAG: 30S ribosomal protein S18 [Candidatus Sungbacteria bacterium]|uniref:Small ribosomal subunit protein bS18 n=1 Tax=Candidatus Sungiibacteriota bacterium TaxID=2750080 RepID=A0A9D6LMZ3_9BACT|nr:30S ribosomal protein S18 [Candidatus Sungbacteria bacterium]